MPLSNPHYPGELIPGRRVRLPAADVSTFSGASFGDTDPVTGLVCRATGAGISMRSRPYLINTTHGESMPPVPLRTPQ